jgi:hypothetical protein
MSDSLSVDHKSSGLVGEACRAACVHVPRLRIDLAHRQALNERLNAMEESLLGVFPHAVADLQLEQVQLQVAFLRARDWAVKAAGYIDGALVNLAHSAEAFGQIESELEPSLAEHFRDTVADELVYAPMQGIAPEAAARASLAAVADLLSLAESLHEKAFHLLNAANRRS